MMGFSLLNKYLPASAKSSLSTTPLKSMTQSISRGMIARLRDTGWIITAPDGTKNTLGGDMRGSGYGFPMVRIGEYIFQETCENPAMLFHMEALWWNLGYRDSDRVNNNVKMVRMLLALSNLVPLGDNFAHCLREDSLRDIYPVIQSLLFNESFSPADQNHLYNHLGQILTSCPERPMKGGVGTPPPLFQSVAGWRTTNRWVHNGIEELDDESGWQAATLYNGIDYMLAYNLYHLNFFPDTKYQPYQTPVVPVTIPKFSAVYQSQYALANVKDAVYYNPMYNQVFYRGTDNRMYVYYQDLNEWKVKCINTQINNVGDQVFYDSARHKIYYRGTDNKMHNFYLANNVWNYGCLSQSVSNLTADVVYDEPNGKIYYRGTDNRMYTFHWLNNQWNHGSLIWGVSNVAGNVVLAEGKVFYRGTDNRVYQLAIVNNQWQHMHTCYAATNIKDNLMYVKGGHNKFFYRGTDDRLYLIYYNSGQWHYGAVHGAAVNVGNKIIHDTATGKLFYVSKQNTLHTVYWEQNQWRHGNLDNKQNIVRPDFFISAVSGRLYYAGGDNKLYYFYWTGSRWKSICPNHHNNSVAGFICTNSAEDKIFYKSTGNKICSAS